LKSQKSACGKVLRRNDNTMFEKTKSRNSEPVFKKISKTMCKP